MKTKPIFEEEKIKDLQKALYITNGTNYLLSEIKQSFSLLSKKDSVKIEKYWTFIIDTFDKIDMILNETLENHYYEKNNLTNTY